MAAGPIAPSSAHSTTPDIVPGFFEGATNLRAVECHKVAASLGADRTLELLFDLFRADPSGTLKLQIISFANVSATQVAKLRVLWAAVAAGENYDTIALQDEHAAGDLTISHATTDDDEPVLTEVTLDADTISYGTDLYLLMHIDLKTTGWTLAVPWYFQPRLVWA